MKRLGVLVALGVVLGIYFGVAKNKDDEHEIEQKRSESTVVAPTPPVPVEHEPEYAEPREDAPDGAKRVDVAMHALYTRCSKYAVFREGSHIAGNTVFKKDSKTPERVNVQLRLARPEVADGNVLWYMVTFDKAGKEPVLVQATKDIAAQLCGMPAREVDVPLNE